jgi:hypothetical protein
MRRATSISTAAPQTVRDYVDNELDNLVTGDDEDAKPTAGFQRVIQRAVIHVQSSGREEVTGANVLVAIFAERESHAAYFLQEQDMTRYDAVNYISPRHRQAPRHVEKAPVARRGGRADSARRVLRRERRPRRRADALTPIASTSTRRPRPGKIDPLIGRDGEVSAHHPDPVPPVEEQSAVRRRSRRRQDGHRRRPGQAHRRMATCPRCSGRDHLLARHGRAAGRHALSRRFRGTPEAGGQGNRGLSRARSCSSTRSTP